MYINLIKKQIHCPNLSSEFEIDLDMYSLLSMRL